MSSSQPTISNANVVPNINTEDDVTAATTSNYDESTMLSSDEKKRLDNVEFSNYRGVNCFDCIPQDRRTTTKVAISWTGGKDCHLAFQRCTEHGLDVVCGATFFAPAKAFNAHRMEWQQIQGTAIGIPIIQCPLLQLESNPTDYAAAYAAAIRILQTTMNVEYLVTGDIDFVGSSTTNFMQQVVSKYDCGGMKVLLPLWQQDRKDLLLEMISSHKFDIRLCCVKTPHFDESWIGRSLDETTLQEMELKTVHGLDLGGEAGEYHTMVVNGPMYQTPLHFCDVSAKELIDQRGQKSNERWWVIDERAKLESRIK